MKKVKKFNYANDEHFSEIIERYGGEVLLKEKFPRILEMLHNTREYHQMLASEKVNNNSNKDENGYEDDFGIDVLPVDCSKATHTTAQEKNVYGVYSASHLSMIADHPFITMNGKIHDQSGKAFAAFSLYDKDNNKLASTEIVDSRYLDYTDQPTVISDTHFNAYDTINGKSICTFDAEATSVISIKEMNHPTVEKIEVIHPKSKNTTDTQIRIVYNGRKDNNAAYNFKNAKRHTDYLVEVYFPFHIKVTLDENFSFDPEKPIGDIRNAYIRLASKVVKGGAVHFPYEYREKIKVDPKGNILEVDFAYSENTEKNFWSTLMVLGAKETKGDFDFHLNFDINYGFKGTGIYDQQPAIIVSSEQLPDSQNYVKIKSSHILWGCLGKDTMIRTENGYSRIDEIKVGENIFTNKGFIRLKNMVTGTEEKIIAVGVDKDKTLYITAEHAIASKRGIIRAIDLLATDKLQTEEGIYKDIYYLEVIDYNDKIYSPELEEPALISAGGIMVGDYLTMPQEIKVTEKKCEPLDPVLVEELEKWHAIKSEQIKKEIIL